MTGKEKCEFLKNIRKEIAQKNGLDYNPEPCYHEGNCMGTCSKCDKEAAEIMDSLRRMQESGCSIIIDYRFIQAYENAILDNTMRCNDDFSLESPVIHGDLTKPGITAGYVPIIKSTDYCENQLDDWDDWD